MKKYPGKSRRFTDKQKQAICKSHQKGVTITVLAKKYKCGWHTIERALTDCGVEPQIKDVGRLSKARRAAGKRVPPGTKILLTQIGRIKGTTGPLSADEKKLLRTAYRDGMTVGALEKASGRSWDLIRRTVGHKAKPIGKAAVKRSKKQNIAKTVVDATYTVSYDDDEQLDTPVAEAPKPEDIAADMRVQIARLEMGIDHAKSLLAMAVQSLNAIY